VAILHQSRISHSWGDGGVSILRGNKRADCIVSWGVCPMTFAFKESTKSLKSALLLGLLREASAGAKNTPD
jgi:hypothetical protein